MHERVKVGDEIHHLVSEQIACVEILSDLHEAAHVMPTSSDHSPALAERVLDSLQFPQETEDLQVPEHDFRS